MKKLISFLLIIALVLTAIPAVNADAAKKVTKKLSVGEYIVGEDIPAGKYDLRGVEGWGIVTIYKSEKDYDNDNEYKMMCLCSKGCYERLKSVYTMTYKNLKLKNGYYISVQYALTVKFRPK